jgi:hypothetical protein
LYRKDKITAGRQTWQRVSKTVALGEGLRVRGAPSVVSQVSQEKSPAIKVMDMEAVAAAALEAATRQPVTT